MHQPTILIGVDPKNPNLAFAQDPIPEEKATATQLPEPRGFSILCAIPEVEETYGNGIIKADVTRSTDELTTMVLFVISMGDMAYNDPNRFPTGAWCKVGDFVLVRPYAGTRVKIHGKEFRIITDDSIIAVVEDPRGIARC